MLLFGELIIFLISRWPHIATANILVQSLHLGSLTSKILRLCCCLPGSFVTISDLQYLIVFLIFLVRNTFAIPLITFRLNELSNPGSVTVLGVYLADLPDLKSRLILRFRRLFLMVRLE